MSGLLLFFFFFFKQKTAYEMRISDWSSDVCSSDLDQDHAPVGQHHGGDDVVADTAVVGARTEMELLVVAEATLQPHAGELDRLRIGEALRQRHREIGRASCRERVCQYV